MRGVCALVPCLLCGACQAGVGATEGAATDAGRVLTLSFPLELPPSADEAYLCYGFDAPALDGAAVQQVSWTAPAGGTTLHHAKLWATSQVLSTGTEPFSCDPMPADAIGLHLWLPGGSPLVLPADVGLRLPSGTRTLVVEAHALRTGDAPSRMASVSIAKSSERPAKIATWLGLDAPVPAIRPMMREQSTAQCTLSSAFHALYSVPHMHLVGAEFHARRIRDGASEAIVDVLPWDFAAQETYATAADFAPGDVLEATCVWENPTSSYVLPGIYTKNEMCTFGLIGWPDGVSCTRPR